ncbi:MAG: twin-arginine translocase TatA/TatE family subunit [Armatimonadetes bacterium]|nr:twin-arginine translocase TatA/TatE family subunit [Armatimonadota bacterium]MBS1700379.1 twin-arginine translocase TatA/TatE family subunit [Armatimonadota bacterium]MBS1725410.1 twin-arginine translocase TatA/TatE family subunit [Armatimonadota bacterium]
MPGLPGGSEWIVIALVILLLFGGDKLPELMRGIGRGVGELQRGLEDGKRKLEEAIHDESNQ